MKGWFSIFFIFWSTMTYAQGTTYKRIQLQQTNIQELAQLGICLDHAVLTKEGSCILEASPWEQQQLKKAGLTFEVLEKHLTAFYRDPSRKTRSENCFESDFSVPEHFYLGSQGGFYSYTECFQVLDSMQTLFPGLISDTLPIDTFRTYEGEPLYLIKMGKDPLNDEDKPKVLFTSIHHGREPASLSQLIFFMWYLLEHYGHDAYITQLLDNTSLHFVPMLNPDGYRYNEQISPGGGGMWRKNRRPTGGSSYGVDLNRNYGYLWGTSSSSDPNSDVYHGDSAFSEVETRAMRYLCIQEQYLGALNAHSFGNLLLYPFGHDAIETEDHDGFLALGKALTAENNYFLQMAASLYPASGDSDDYMYAGDLDKKPAMWSFTPEIGNQSQGFWPPEEDIVPLGLSALSMNLKFAGLAGSTGDLKHVPAAVHSTGIYEIPFALQQLGLGDESLEVRFTPLQGLAAEQEIRTYDLSFVEEQLDTFKFQVEPTLTEGSLIRYALCSNMKCDTFEVLYATPLVLFSDAGNTMDNWNTGSNAWGTTSTAFSSPIFSITDSPNSNYGANAATYIQLNQSISIAGYRDVYLNFRAKWDIEQTYDFARVFLSPDEGLTWYPLCGQYSVPGSDQQVLNTPLYDGKSDWISEYISLGAYIGEEVLLRFNFNSDGGIQRDGIYLDDIQVLGIPLDVSVLETNAASMRLYPQPGFDQVQVLLPQTWELPVQVTLLNTLGQVVQQETCDEHAYRLDVGHLENGMYHIVLQRPTGEVMQRKLLVQH